MAQSDDFCLIHRVLNMGTAANHNHDCSKMRAAYSFQRDLTESLNHLKLLPSHVECLHQMPNVLTKALLLVFPDYSVPENTGLSRGCKR